MDYNINVGIFAGVFAVPDSIIDEHIKIATGEQLKILLYCLRHSGESLSTGEISRATGVAPDNVISGFEFWGQRGLFGENPSVALNEEINKEINEKSKEIKKSPNQNEKLVLIEREHEFTPTEIAKTLKENALVEYLFQRCEQLYGRVLHHYEQKMLVVIIEEHGMKPEVLLMLMEYCFSIEKSAPAYIKKIARIWLEDGVDSIEKADERIRYLKKYDSAERELLELFEVKAIPDARRKLVEKWLFEFKFPVEVVYKAYQVALEKTGKLQYTYMDKVLSDWNINGVDSKKTKYKPLKKAEAVTSFDLDALDRQIMEEYGIK